jgi:hypothetical protein
MPPTARGRRERAGLGRAAADEVDRDDDHQHVERALDDRRGADQRDDESRPTGAAQEAHAVERVPRGLDRFGLGADRPVGRIGHRPNSEHSPAPIATPAAQAAKTVPGPESAYSRPAANGAIAIDTFCTVPDATLAAVSSSVVAASEGRIEAVGGPGQRHRDRRQGREEVDHQRRRVGRERDRPGRHHDRLDDVREEQLALPSETAAERRHDRGDDRGGATIVNATRPDSAAPPRWKA